MASVSTFDLTRFSALAAGDVIGMVDISDTTQSAHGSLDSITVTNFFGTIPVPVVITSTGSLVVTAANGVRFGATAAPAGITGLFTTENQAYVTPDTNSNVLRGSVFGTIGYGAVPRLIGARSGGTVTIPTAVIDANLLTMQGVGYDGTDWAIGAEVVFTALGTWSGANRGTAVAFQTTPSGSTSRTTSFSFSHTGTTSRFKGMSTAMSWRNNADDADNLIITDAGAATFRTTVGIGTAAAANRGLVLAGTITAASGTARILSLGTTMAASANSDTLIGANLGFAATPGAFTGLAIRGAVVVGVTTTGYTSPADPVGLDVQTVTGTGATNGYGIRIVPGTGATNNYLIAHSTPATFNVKTDGSAAFAGSVTAGGLVTTPASTTATAGLRLPSGTAPTSPVSGDIWYDGTNLKFQDGGTTRTLTWV